MNTPFVSQKNKSIKNIAYSYFAKHLPESKDVMISVIISNKENGNIIFSALQSVHEQKKLYQIFSKI